MNHTIIAPIVMAGIPAILLSVIILTVYFTNNKSLDPLKPIGDSILHWTWTKSLLYWIIISAGTMAECAFLLASLWMSLNASIHKFILLFMDEQATVHVSELATAAYVALPECILGLAFVTTISHFHTWLYNKKNWSSLTWCILYGVPTLVFLVLSLFTLGNSVLSVHFELPGFMVVTRAEAGYMFAFVALIYSQLGKPQEADRLLEKDGIIRDLTEQCRRMSGQIEDLTSEMASHKQLLAESKTANKRLLEELDKSDDAPLQAYGDDCINWLKSGAKTVLIEDIIRYTGHSRRKINGANLARSTRNPDLILVSSLVLWLKNTPPPTHKADEKILYMQPQEAVNVS